MNILLLERVRLVINRAMNLRKRLSLQGGRLFLWVHSPLGDFFFFFFCSPLTLIVTFILLCHEMCLTCKCCDSGWAGLVFSE